MALMQATKDAIWLRSLLANVGIVQTSPTLIYVQILVFLKSKGENLELDDGSV
jgi:hypothetical protein